jgi:hypothetical protein
MVERFVRLLPLGASPFAVHLVRAEAEIAEGADPGFARVGDASPFARRYRAALLSESGLKLGDLVLKLPVDATMEAFFPDEGPSSSNAAQEARWAAALGDLVKLQGPPAFFPELVLPSGSAEGSAPALLPPLLFCPTASRLFAIPCPVCLGALHTCRDDQALARAGVPVFSSTTTRLLTCQVCRDAGRPEQFFVTSAEGAGELAELGVKDLAELKRQLAAELERRRGAGESMPAAELPCPGCPEVATCIGLKEGEKAASSGKKKARPAAVTAGWTVFNSHDSPYLLTRFVTSSLTQFADRLGGRRSPEDSIEGARTGLLFADEGSGIDAAEVLALKLTLFLQTVQAVREYYRRLQLPHLDLHPDRVAVELTEPGPYLPRLWSFRVRLLGGSSARLFRLGETVEVVLPPRELRAPFCAPAVREFAQTASRRAELTVDRLVPEPSDATRMRLEGRLGDANGIAPRPGTRDFIVLVIPEDVEGFGGRSILTQIDPRGKGSGGGLPVTSEPMVVDAGLVKRIERAGGLRIGTVRYKVYPQLGVDEDCFALGALLLRILLVNDRQDLMAVTEVVDAVLAEQRAETALPSSGSLRLEGALKSALMLHGPALAKANVFHDEADRASNRANSLPDECWKDVLRLAFGLLDQGIPRGRARDRAPGDPAPLDIALRQGEGLLRRILSVLFRRQMVNLEIQAVIAEVLADSTAAAG